MDVTRYTPLVGRGVFVPHHNALLIADLHLGKEATFCGVGIAVPRGASDGTLRSIGQMLQATGATHLFILGDLFHARSSLADDVKTTFAKFLTTYEKVKVTLVLGNHDRSVGKLPDAWEMRSVDSPWVWKDIELSHFPGPASENCELRIAGHIHPAIKLRGLGVGKIPCFHYDIKQRCLTLPAIGEFTGTQSIKPSACDKVWVIADGDVIKIDPTHFA